MLGISRRLTTAADGGGGTASCSTHELHYLLLYCKITTVLQNRFTDALRWLFNHLGTCNQLPEQVLWENSTGTL